MTESELPSTAARRSTQRLPARSAPEAPARGRGQRACAKEKFARIARCRCAGLASCRQAPSPRAPRNYWIHSGSAIIATKIRINCPAASGSAWPSPGRWPTIHLSSSWTNRPAAWDSAATTQVFGILRDLVTQRGKTVVAVTHDLNLASQMHRRIHVVDGRLAKDETSVSEPV